MTIVLLKTNMKELPPSCSVCSMWERGGCNLPQKRHKDEVKKRYLESVHKDCTLLIINVQEGVANIVGEFAEDMETLEASDAGLPTPYPGTGNWRDRYGNRT